MPLPKRHIEPNFVARSGYARSEDLTEATELETVTNTTLTNIIRQLSSLSKHSEDLFAELAYEAGTLAEHTNSLQARIDRLAIKVTQLDSTIEEVSLQDIQLKKAFKSATVFDQQIFSRATMPTAMLETYQMCDKPPPLDKLNCYRDDGKDGLKFYTDPNYFFELWRQEMIEDTKRMMHGKKAHRGGSRDGPDSANGAANTSATSGGGHSNNNNHANGSAITGSGGGRGNKNKRPRAPQNTTKMQVDKSIHNGETVNYQPPNSAAQHYQQQTEQQHQQQLQQRASRPDSIGGQLQLNYPSREAVDGGHSNIYAPGQMIQGVGGGATVQYVPRSTYGTAADYQAGGGYAGGDDPNALYAQAAHHQQQQQQQQQQLYGSTGGGAEAIYSPGTPSRTKPRPSQPPPAPPPVGAGGASGSGTPTQANTPTRQRSMSQQRETLPPPPPVPEMMQMMQQQGQQGQQIYSPPSAQHMQAMQMQQQHMQQNGQANNGGQGAAVAAMLLARTHSQSSRSGSPLLGQHQPQGVGVGGVHPHLHAAQLDQNAQVVAQLNSQINTLAHMHLSQQQQQQMHHDLPPPPPIPEYISPRQSPPGAHAPAPPPPPPPPPLLDNGGMGQGIGSIAAAAAAAAAASNGGGLIKPMKLQPKKLLPPIDDTRNDLLNAIRGGITLRKVEKSEQKENERNVGLTDVASILARRVAIELSGTDSDSDSDDDSAGWEENNETFA